jgi:two-component system chemotaxis sensor kinase CheA
MAHRGPKQAAAELLNRLAVDLVMGEEAGGEPWRASVEETLKALSQVMAEAESFEGARLAADLAQEACSASQNFIPRLSAAIEELRALTEGISEPAPPPQAPAALAQDPELLSDFIVESREHLGSIEVQLLTLEQEPANAEAIHTVFRGFHTIKGLAGFLELDEIRQVAHEVETLLDLARNGQLKITPEVIDVVLAAADYLNRWLDRLQAAVAGGPAPEVASPEALLARVRAMLEAPAGSAAPAPAPPDAASAQARPAKEAAEESDAKRGSAERTVKVNTAKLDYLVDMVGELVIAQSLVRHAPELAAQTDSRLARNLSQMARITEEVQKTAMSMRMVTLGRLFQKMARLARDLGRKSGKQLEFETFGEDTELDRNIVEELADPLMHMVRNAVDHGIEPPEERAAAGKPPAARVTLKALHQSGQILIEIGDDGRGLDRQKILHKAVEKGLVEEGAALSDAEVFNLIFQPGFSTAAEVTDVSGRGVGMDVVRKHIQKLRGRIEIRSEAGRGTVFSIKLPLTLAIIDGLVVGVGQHRYIVPIYGVREMLRPSEEQITRLENRGETVMVRDRLLPLVRLHQVFQVEPKSAEPCESLLIVAEAEEKSFCLMVDELIGKQEVVIKSLGDMFGAIPGIAGGAILGDGRVGLILDLSGLYFRTGERR